MKDCRNCFRCVEDERLTISGKFSDLPFLPFVEGNVLTFAKPSKGAQVKCMAIGCTVGTPCEHYESRILYNLKQIWHWRICARARRLYDRLIRRPLGRLRKPVPLQWQEGYNGNEPCCPHCGEMPYSPTQCVFCGQRFEDGDKESYDSIAPILIGMILRYTLMMLVAVAIAFGVAYMEGASAESAVMTCIVPKGQYVNIRQKTRLDASVWGELHNGDTILAIDIKDGWVEFDYEGNAAYAQVKYFEIVENADYVVTANGRVRIRKTPNGHKIGYYAVGTVVYVDAWRYDKNGDLWARIGSGYVSAGYLTPSEGAGV